MSILTKYALPPKVKPRFFQRTTSKIRCTLAATVTILNILRENPLFIFSHSSVARDSSHKLHSTSTLKQLTSMTQFGDKCFDGEWILRKQFPRREFWSAIAEAERLDNYFLKILIKRNNSIAQAAIKAMTNSKEIHSDHGSLGERSLNADEELFLKNNRENGSGTETSALVTVGSGILDKIIRVVSGKTFCCYQCKG